MSRYDGLLGSLREARRYVRSNPDEATRLVLLAQRQLYQTPLGHRLNPTDRIYHNLMAGMRFINVAPDVLRGYIDGAILEIQDHASREKS